MAIPRALPWIEGASIADGFDGDLYALAVVPDEAQHAQIARRLAPAGRGFVPARNGLTTVTIPRYNRSMVDRVSSPVRSAIMASVGTRNTGPELVLRKLLHRAGYRFRLHVRTLPGSPDIAFPRRRKVVFVNGCFWHGHGCRWGLLPKSRREYWIPKIAANRARDVRKTRELQSAGWDVFVVWQCELRAPEEALSRVVAFLEC
ncbi:MAG: very short patch repair endonuclease [Alphaproteobacteria bacterium]